MQLDVALAGLFLIIGVMAAISFYVARNEKRALYRRYQRQEYLFTSAERAFLPILEKALGDGRRVFAKVRVADVIGIRPGTAASARQTALNKISSKHVDFVVCDSATLAICGAVELDDRSHARGDRRLRDEFLDGLFEAVGLPLIRVPVRSGYNLDDIRERVRPLLTPMTSCETPMPHESKVSLGELAGTLNSRCPKCGAALVRRVAKQGQRAGEEFWACSAYPQCRFTRPIHIPVPSIALRTASDIA